MADMLEEIIAAKRTEVARRKRERPLSSLEAELPAGLPRGFVAALSRAKDQGRFGLIAELKKASPSRGLIRGDFRPSDLAKAYRDGGATCLSVLTDQPYFQGDDAHLIEARAAVDLPVLRKDFTVDPYQVVEARAIGADAILLIVAALSDDQLAELVAAAAAQALDILVEGHDGGELERALALPLRLIGINNRNLKTLQIDLTTTETLAPQVPNNRVIVAESGLERHEDLVRMSAAGATCFLVGESLMRQSDVAAATRHLLTGNAG
ncbi:MAG: indole-3-glycerol phosphate synthase TrpC [Geminicoccaceae bacterium]